MRKSLAPLIVATIVALLIFIPAQANMPPPEPFMLGVTVVKDPEGMRITAVAPGSHGERFGLRPGDIIVGINKQWLKPLDAKQQLAAVNALRRWQLDVIVVRDKRDIFLVHMTD